MMRGKMLFLRFHLLYLLYWCAIRPLRRSVLEPTAKPSHAAGSVLRKVDHKDDLYETIVRFVYVTEC